MKINDRKLRILVILVAIMAIASFGYYVAVLPRSNPNSQTKLKTGSGNVYLLRTEINVREHSNGTDVRSFEIPPNASFLYVCGYSDNASICLFVGPMNTKYDNYTTLTCINDNNQISTLRKPISNEPHGLYCVGYTSISGSGEVHIIIFYNNNPYIFE